MPLSKLGTLMLSILMGLAFSACVAGATDDEIKKMCDNLVKLRGDVDLSTIDQTTAEVKERYGGTDAYRESMKKTGRYSAKEWAEVQARGAAILTRLASLMRRDPADPEVQAQAEAWRIHITESYYACSVEMLKNLGELYISDERFTKNIDAYGAGLARFLKEAIDRMEE